MSFEKLPPIDSRDLHIGCLNCSTAALNAPMDMVIAVGFGSAIVTKDDELVYSEDRVENETYWTVQDAENIAKLEPDCDWRIAKHGPLHGETFQRQGDGLWVCVESNQGFA
jgi:hypothetical protein